MGAAAHATFGVDQGIVDISTAAGDVELLRLGGARQGVGSPEELLLWAILGQAFTDLAIRPRRLGPFRVLLEVRAWVAGASELDPSPFTFVAVCERLGIEPSYARTALLRRVQVPAPFIVRRAVLHGVEGIPDEWLPSDVPEAIEAAPVAVAQTVNCQRRWR